MKVKINVKSETTNITSGDMHITQNTYKPAGNMTVNNINTETKDDKTEPKSASLMTVLDKFLELALKIFRYFKQ